MLIYDASRCYSVRKVFSLYLHGKVLAMRKESASFTNRKSILGTSEKATIFTLAYFVTPPDLVS